MNTQPRLATDVFNERIGIERELARSMQKYHNKRRYMRRHGMTPQLPMFLRKQAE